MNPLDHWRKLALDEMHRILKPIGFKKSGINFRRRKDGVWMVFNLQSSSWNSSDRSMVMYGNIGLRYVINDPRPYDSKAGPTEALCDWQARVKGNKGQCFEFSSDEGAVSAGRNIALDGLEILEAVFVKYPTPESMLEAYRENITADRDTWPWSSGQMGLLLKELERAKAIS